MEDNKLISDKGRMTNLAQRETETCISPMIKIIRYNGVKQD